MGVHEYRPGGWTALVTEDAVALLPPTVAPEVLTELWQLTSEGRRLGAWVEYLAASGLSALPSFAMVEQHPQGLRVLVRGEVDVTVEGATLSGRDYTTWREEILPATGNVTLATQAAPSEQPGTPAATDDAWLPIVGGIVRAGTVRVRATSPSEPAPAVDEDDDVELTVARMPALAAATGTSPASASSPSAAADPWAPAAADAEPAPETGETVAQDPSASSTQSAEPEDDYDFLLWPTEQATAHRDERQATAAEAAADEAAAVETSDDVPAAADDAAADDAADPSAQVAQAEADRVSRVAADIETTRAPEPEEDDHRSAQPEPGGIIDSVPGRPAPASPAPVAPQHAPPGHHAPPRPPAPHAPPMGARVDLPPPDDGDHDGQTVLTSEVPRSDVPIAKDPAAPAIPAVELVLSTGPRIEMARPVLIGRAPESARFAGGEAPRLVSVPGADVSATHVEIRPAHGHVVVTDMNSTNGTVVHLPDQPAFRLQPGTGVPVNAGAVIEIGAEVTIRVEEAMA